ESLPAQREQTIAMCDLDLSELASRSAQQQEIRHQIRATGRRWCSDLPNSTPSSSYAASPPLLKGWLCMDMPNPGTVDCSPDDRNGLGRLKIRPVQPSTGLWVPEDWTYLGVASPLPQLWLELLTLPSREFFGRTSSLKAPVTPPTGDSTDQQWNAGTA
ncbi:hypothetical protein FOZ62_019319, partial [Perkinsus olseni]